MNARAFRRFLLIVLVQFLGGSLSSQVQEPKRPFTASDDVQLSTFQGAFYQRGDRGDLVVFSPNGRCFAVVTERGLLSANVPEDTIWIFQIQEVQSYLEHPEKRPPRAIPLVRMASDKDGPIIEQVRWLDDSSGVAFLAVKRTENFRFHQLFLADVASGVVKPMTPDDQDVSEFDVRSSNYVYEVVAPELRHAPSNDLQTPEVLTGRNLSDVLFPFLLSPPRLTTFNDAGLWAMIDGVRFPVKDRETGRAVTEVSALSLSPDGGSIIAILKTDNPPDAWRKYKPVTEEHDLGVPLAAEAYYLVDLRTGRKMLLVNAPTGRNRDHWNNWQFRTRWSHDGKSVLLSHAFLPLDAATPEENVRRQGHPCAAVVRVPTHAMSCVLTVTGLNKDRFAITDFRFEDNRTVVIDFDQSYFLRDQPASAVFQETSADSWKVIPGAVDSISSSHHINVEVLADINQPPVIVADGKSLGKRHIVWDPNPQLADVEIGRGEIEHWTDASGYDWEAGLVLPAGYIPGQRYPLVIQTHGFDKNQFLANGSYPSAFAARALAAAGIMVLQMPGNYATYDSPHEGMAQIEGFESAVKNLAEKGMVDLNRIGIIGWSRTVYHVLEELTKGKLQFSAASVTDGITLSYCESVAFPDLDYLIQGSNHIYHDGPFTKDGLKNWLENAPGFNMEKVNTPLLLLQPSKQAVFWDWEPYAALRSLHKPVDLVMIPGGQHIMTNPKERFYSETLNVDWFRFWLKREEDSDPMKADQYARWRGLHKLQLSGQTLSSLP